MTAEQTLDKVRQLVGVSAPQPRIYAPDATIRPTTEPATIRALAEYGAKTGHRLVLDYRNPHGKRTVDRKVVVQKVKDSPHGLPRTYVYVYDQGRSGFRTLILSRIEKARLDG